MASNRDTLIELIDDTRADGHSPREAADYLLDAGWRPPAREITTAAELDALPEWSAVLDRDPKGRKAWVKLGPYWYLPAYRPHYTASQVLCFGAAITVLYVPTEEAGRG